MPEKKSYGRTKRGKPLTDELIEHYAADAEAGLDLAKLRRRGRPRMGSAPANSFPVRLDPQLRAALDERAQRTGVSAAESYAPPSGSTSPADGAVRDRHLGALPHIALPAPSETPRRSSRVSRAVVLAQVVLRTSSRPPWPGPSLGPGVDETHGAVSSWRMAPVVSSPPQRGPRTTTNRRRFPTYVSP